jgi:transcriptional regulator with XRE-family HTH domain
VRFTLTQPELGRAIQQARLHAGITQVELAACLGTSQSEISALEHGRGGLGRARLQTLLDALDAQLELRMGTNRPAAVEWAGNHYRIAHGGQE